MSQYSFLMYFVAFIAAIWVLRLARFTFTFGMLTIEKFIESILPEGNAVIKGFFLKIDYVVNQWALFKIGTFRVRWHFIAAFLYVITR